MMNSFSLAQQTVKFSAQIRPRLEIDNRDFNSNTPFYNTTALRTRLGLSFSPTNDLIGFIQLQDSRFFGGETNTMADMKNVDLHQAYFKIDNLFKLPIDVKVGRMEVTYGNERLMGAVNWSNIGRSFDGAIITVKGEKIKVDIFNLKETEKFNFGDTLDQNIYGVYSNLMIVQNYKIQPFIIWQRQIPSKLLDRVTLGAYVKGDIGAFTHETEFAYQFGEITISNNKQDVSAFMFAFNVGYTFDAPSKPMIGAAIDYLSGDDNQLDYNYKTFNTLYATNHKFYGFMDYFTDLPTHTYGLGLMDLIGKLEIMPVENLKVTVMGHIFNANADYKLKSGSNTRNFGSEIDLLLNFTYNANITFEGGATLFSPGDIFQEKKGTGSSTWFYLMAVVNL